LFLQVSLRQIRLLVVSKPIRRAALRLRMRAWPIQAQPLP
jgi:hypothetical protein